MENSRTGTLSDAEANRMLNEILEEDREENLDDDDEDDDEGDESECTAACAGDPAVKKRFCECTRIAENSSRFSLRVMEAMRLLQRKEDRLIPTSTAEDIVDYIQATYHDDGDLYAQVRTTLKQVCSQGFVMELLENEYHLIGPNAISMNQATCTKGRRDCALSSPVKTPKLRRKRDNNGDDCDCETTTDEEPEPASKSQRVWINKSKRNTRRQHEEREENVAAREVPQCSCNRIDEDRGEDECVCEDQVQRNARHNSNSRVQKREDVQENDHRRINEERQTRPVQDFLMESSRKRNVQGRNRTMEIVDRTTTGNNRPNQAISDNVDNFYSELQGKILSSGDKKRKRELKAWIKRCQEECKRQENRRNRNN